MNVELLQHTSLAVCAHAIRTCWASHDKSDTPIVPQPSYSNELNYVPHNEPICGPNDLALIDRVGNKHKHASTLEHLSYTFFISGVSRALLQELARHRMASPSVKSSRYTLKELKQIDDVIPLGPHGERNITPEVFTTCSKFLVFTGILEVDNASCRALLSLQELLKSGVGNDRAKYCMPEAYKTELTWTINARSLQNFLYLRSSPSALWEIRDLAQAIYEQLPADHKYLFTESLYDGQD